MSALKLIKRVQALSPEVPEWEILVILAKPWIMSRIQETLQPQDVEGCRQELFKKQLRPSKGRGAESLQILCTYLVNMIQGLRDAGPPAPLTYQDDEDEQYEDIEHAYYNIQVPRAYVLEGDEWWAPGLSHPCGLPGHVHSLAVCPKFWCMTPMDRHSKLYSGSVCKTCLGPQSVCCPVEFSCSTTIPEGLQCTGCQRLSHLQRPVLHPEQPFTCEADLPDDPRDG